MDKIINWYNTLSMFQKTLFISVIALVVLLIFVLLCMSIVYGIKSNSLSKKLEKKEIEKKQLIEKQNKEKAQAIETIKSMSKQQYTYTQNAQPPQIINNITAPSYSQPPQPTNSVPSQNIAPQQIVNTTPPTNFTTPQIIYVPIPQQTFIPQMFMQQPFYNPYYNQQLLPNNVMPTNNQIPPQNVNSPVDTQVGNKKNENSNLNFYEPNLYSSDNKVNKVTSSNVEIKPDFQTEVSSNVEKNNSTPEQNVDTNSINNQNSLQDASQNKNENLNKLQSFIDKVDKTIYRNSKILTKLIKEEKGLIKKEHKTFDELVKELPILQQAYYEEIKEHALSKQGVTTNVTANIETISVGDYVALLFKIEQNELEVMFDLEGPNGELAEIKVLDQEIVNQVNNLLDSIYASLSEKDK